MMSSYLWVLVLAGFGCFFMAFGIGANDFGNSWAHVIGARALSYRHTLLLGVVCEVVGAAFLSARSTGSVRSGIIDYKAFAQQPEVLLYGMMCALAVAALWLYLACRWDMAVSTTHTIMGSLIGVGLAVNSSIVVWSSKAPHFPYLGGVAAMVLAWVFSPTICAMLAALAYNMLRTRLLRREDVQLRVLWALPAIAGVTTALGAMLLQQKACAARWATDKQPLAVQLAIAGGVGGGGALVTALGLAALPLLRRAGWQLRGGPAEAAIKKDREDAVWYSADLSEGTDRWHGVLRFITDTLDGDIHAAARQQRQVASQAERAEQFDQQAERHLAPLQVAAAICLGVSHGANDSMNANSSLAAAYALYRTGAVAASVPVPPWIRAIGALGLALGILTFSFNVNTVLGAKLAHLTPARGLAVALGTMSGIIVSSLLYLPSSTTHCVVGATMGVGALEGAGSTNWRLFRRTVTGWVLTVTGVAALTAALFAQASYAPSIPVKGEANACMSSVAAATSTLVKVLAAVPAVNSTAAGAAPGGLAALTAIAKAAATQLSAGSCSGGS